MLRDFHYMRGSDKNQCWIQKRSVCLERQLFWIVPPCLYYHRNNNERLWGNFSSRNYVQEDTPIAVEKRKFPGNEIERKAKFFIYYLLFVIYKEFLWLVIIYLLSWNSRDKIVFLVWFSCLWSHIILRTKTEINITRTDQNVERQIHTSAALYRFVMQESD